MRKLLLLFALLLPVRLFAQVTITNLGVTATTTTSSQIQWTTSGPASTQVVFGVNGVLNSNTVNDPTLVTSHTATITGIFTGSVFSYAAVSIDGSNNKTQSPTQQFQLCNTNSGPNAGFTQTSGTINWYYEFGSYVFTWVNQSGQSVVPTICGNAITNPISGNLDASGSFNIPVPDDLQIVPSPGNWTITVRSTGGIGSYTAAGQDISGPSKNVNALLMAGVVGLTTHCFLDQSTGILYPPNCSGANPVSGTLNHIAKITPNANSVGDSEGIATGISAVQWPLGVTLVTRALHLTLLNSSSPGTTCNLLTALDSNNNARDAQPSDANNLIGISDTGCGTTGSVDVAYSGQQACLFDNTAALSDWVILGNNSECHDAGAVEPTGPQAIGRVSSINTGTGTPATVYLGLPNITSPAGNPGTVSVCSTPLAVAFYHVIGGTIICDPGFTTDGAGNVSATTLTLTGSGAGFIGFTASTVPLLSVSNTAYFYADTTIPASFGTALPSTPGSLNQVLGVTAIVDGTHIKTGWINGGGSGSCAEDTCIVNNPSTDQTIAGIHQLILDGGSFSVFNDAIVPINGLNSSNYNEIIPPVNSGMPSGIRLAAFSGSFGWQGTGVTPTGIQADGVFLQPSVSGGITGGEMKTFISYNPDFEDGSTLSGLVGFECDHAAIGSAQVTSFNTCFSGAVSTGGWAIDVTGAGGSAAFSIHRVCHSNDQIQNGGVPTDCWWSGNGSPNGVVTAAVGSFYAQLDGGAGTSWWFKESGAGNTGWLKRSDFTGSTGIFTGLNVIGLSAGSIVCTDGSKNLATSGCPGGSGVTSIATTSPITGGTITTTGTIACATCVVASSPGAGIAHFAGSTQTITSSSIVNADIAAATIDLTAKVTGILPAANGGTANGFFAVSGPASSTKTFTFPNANATITQTIASGTAALGTGAITSGTCATVVTTSATGVATTDVVRYGFNGDPTGVTGYAPSASGMLTIITYPTVNNVNVKVCNNTGSSITPGAVTLNWQVTR